MLLIEETWGQTLFPMLIMQVYIYTEERIK